MKNYLLLSVLLLSAVFTAAAQDGTRTEEEARRYVAGLASYKTSLRLDKAVSKEFLSGSIHEVRRLSAERDVVLMQTIDSIMAYFPDAAHNETAARLVCRLTYNLGHAHSLKAAARFDRDFEPLCLQQLRKQLEEEAKVAEGREASDFRLMDRDGREYTLASFKDRPVFLEFSASWCGWCRKEIPYLRAAYEKYGDKIAFVTVFLDENREKWLKAVDEEKLPWLCLSDLKGMGSPAAAGYHVSGVPNCYLIGTDGRIKAKGLRREEVSEAMEKLLAPAQEIRFEQGSFAEALEQAAAQKRLVFMDCYTSWCAPCRMMNKTVLKDPKVVSFFNSHFVNVKFDMEKGEGRRLSARYGMKVFPTYLLLDEKGNEVHRVVGGHEADEFVALIQAGLDGGNSISALRRRYEEGDRDAAFLHRYIKTLGNGYCFDEIPEVLDALCQKRGEQATAEDWELISRYLSDPTSATFRFVTEHRSLFSRYTTAEKLEEWIYGVLYTPIYNSINDAVYDASKHDGKRMDALAAAVRQARPAKARFLESCLEFYSCYHTGKIKKVLSIFRKEFAGLESGDRLRICMQMNFMLYTKGNVKECREGLEIFRKLFHPKDPILDNFRRSLEKRMASLQ